jgi:hypothetical protein
MTKIVGNQKLKTFYLYVKNPSAGINDWFERMRSNEYGMIDDQSMKFKKQGFQTKIISSDSHRVARKQLQG